MDGVDTIYGINSIDEWHEILSQEWLSSCDSYFMDALGSKDRYDPM